MDRPIITRADIDALQQAIAEQVAAHPEGVRLVTEEILRERLQYYAQQSVEEARRIGPESDPDTSDFVAKVAIFGAHGQEARNINCGFTTENKRHRMAVVAEVCRVTLAQGLIFRNNGTVANSSKLAEMMGLNHPDPHDRQKMDYFESRMWKWIKSNYGKERLAALPPELRRDCLFIFGMGPHLPELGIMLEYQWKDGIMTTEGGEIRPMQNSLIPRWWV